MRFTHGLFGLIGILLLTGCGGGTGGSAPAVPKLPSGGQQPQTVSVVINIPKATVSSSKTRPNYISPATQSLTLIVKRGATVALSETANLTPTSSGCASTLASTQCTLTLSLDPGSYTASLSTYDGTNGTGNVLSAGQNVPFTVVAGTNNAIPLTLSGVPASFIVTPQNNVTSGSYAQGFTIAGMQAQTFLVNTLDADGNTIVGAGAPTLAVAMTSGSGWTIANPTATLPNTFAITPATTQNSAATLQITASFSDSTCSLSNAVCTVTFNVKNDLPTLFVAACSTSGCGGGSDAVLVYAPPYTGTPTTITSSIDGPEQLALDGSQDLYVANTSGGTIYAYSLPYGSPFAGIGGAVRGVQVMPNGTMLVTTALAGPSQTIFEYSSIFAATTNILALSPSATNQAVAVLDANGNAWLQESTDALSELLPPQGDGGATTTTVPSTTIEAFVVSPAGNVYVAGTTLVALGAAGSTLTGYTLTSGHAYGVTYDPSGDAIAATTSGVLIVSPSASLLTTITSGVSIATPTQSAGQIIACDDGYDIFVANTGAQTVTIYEPPYTSTAVTIPTGYVPQAVLLGP